MLVAPELGRGMRYRSMLGKHLDLPIWIFLKLRRWNELSVLKSRKNLQMLQSYASMADEPEKLHHLITLVRDDLGYALFQAVERTKVALSTEQAALFDFTAPDVSIQVRVTRSEFEAWIAPETSRIESTLDRLLADVGVASGEVDTVFLTGGTARVPAVRTLFQRRFGEDRIRSGDFLASVASGLAVHARTY